MSRKSPKRTNIELSEEMRRDFDAIRGSEDRKAYLAMLLKGLLEAPRHLRNALIDNLDEDLRGKALQDIVDFFNRKLGQSHPIDGVKGAVIGAPEPSPASPPPAEWPETPGAAKPKRH